MRVRLLLAAAATLTLAACSATPTAPSPRAPTVRSSDDVPPGDDGTCRSGYHLATRDDGSSVCQPD